MAKVLFSLPQEFAAELNEAHEEVPLQLRQRFQEDGRPLTPQARVFQVWPQQGPRCRWEVWDMGVCYDIRVTGPVLNVYKKRVPPTVWLLWLLPPHAPGHIRVVRASFESVARRVAGDGNPEWEDPAQCVCMQLDPRGGPILLKMFTPGHI